MKFAATARRTGAVILLLSTSLLGGCFIAEGDEADPIIPDATLAYPMKMGAGKECTETTDQDPTCNRALFEKLPDGGYSITIWTVDDDGSESEGEPSQYRLRLLKGAGVPAATFLVQEVSYEEAQRYLGLLRKRPEGGWLRISPNCDKLTPDAFVEFMTAGWLSTEEGTTLNGMTCAIVRSGLDDARLYQILSAAKPDDDPTVLYDGG